MSNIKQKIFNLLQNNRLLPFINKISDLEYEFKFNGKYVLIEKEPDIDDDRWIYWYKSNISNEIESYKFIDSTIKNLLNSYDKKDLIKFKQI